MLQADRYYFACVVLWAREDNAYFFCMHVSLQVVFFATVARLAPQYCAEAFPEYLIDEVGLPVDILLRPSDTLMHALDHQRMDQEHSDHMI